MADGVFNVSKGRVAEFVQRLLDNDPTGCEVVVTLMEGAASDATLVDVDTFAALFALGDASEADFTNFARTILTNASQGGLTRTVDDTNDRQECDLSDITFASAGGATNNTLTRLITGFDSSGAGTDSGIVPMTFHDFAETTTGSDIIAQFASTGFFRAA